MNVAVQYEPTFFFSFLLSNEAHAVSIGALSPDIFAELPTENKPRPDKALKASAMSIKACFPRSLRYACKRPMWPSSSNADLFLSLASHCARTSRLLDRWLIYEATLSFNPARGPARAIVCTPADSSRSVARSSMHMQCRWLVLSSGRRSLCWLQSGVRLFAWRSHGFGCVCRW